MKVIICGAGQVGWQLARHLSRENNDVTVVDMDANLIRRISETLDVNGITGFASYPDVLEKAGAKDADMIIAATFADEVNMVTCQVAHSMFNIPRKIARLRSQSYLDAIYSDLYRQDHMPIDVVISPEREVAEAALRRLAVPAAFDTERFFDGDADMLGIDIGEDCPVINTPLRQLTELFSTLRAVVAGVSRDNKMFVPGAGDQLFPGDQIYVIAAHSDVARTLEIFGKTRKKGERAIVIGGGNVGLVVAQKLEQGENRVRVKLIERSRKVAETAADALERTIVLHGDGLDMDLLDEANIGKTDALLAVTDDDKTNLLSCVRAKAMGCPLVIALINDPSLASLMGPLGIDAFINPRTTTVSSILRHIRHGRIRAVYSLGDAEAELIEAQVMGTSALSGKIIREIDWPEGSLVGMVKKGDKMVVPRGDTKLEEGDSLIVFALAADVPHVEKLFQVSLDFF